MVIDEGSDASTMRFWDSSSTGTVGSRRVGTSLSGKVGPELNPALGAEGAARGTAATGEVGAIHIGKIEKKGRENRRFRIRFGPLPAN